MKSLSQISARSMHLFLAIVREGNLSEVARNEGLAASSLSRVVQQLEEALETQLLYRNTRAVIATDAGHIYADAFRTMLQQLADAQIQVGERRDQPGGRIRINAPISFGLRHIGPRISELSERYPALNIELNLNDDYIDPFADGTDLLLRIASLKDSELHGRLIASQRCHLVATPAYLRRFGRPESPEALQQHRLLAYRGKTGLQRWRFHTGEQHYQFSPQAKIVSDNAELLLQAANNDAGILLYPDWQVGEMLNRGELVDLLPEFSPTYSAAEQSLWLLYPGGRYPSLNTRTVIDFLLASFGSPPYWRYQTPSAWHTPTGG
ncbi:DNA-binding transcriptional regulator, LysR family [Kosakonia oryzendophytica]|uniref:DNA-binding transcriptional regulator, LysR family n=1 Tax=Kosakonia oryzendophytica TaxID=1005665 RepID=A0A1C4BMM7_9ENTR|nr:LysR family transcriptional regulator [Kosakonia oryzendophytica]TDT59521.1 DNA-binding transcriptional LysR family regulator [Enterobacter sp. AG5470]SCC08070.1 DNA-binding transcriptional regulator, LysR family [Kosakonia oryzendophytica]